MKHTTTRLLFFLSFCSILTAQNCYDTTYTGDGTFYDSIAGTSSGNCGTPIAIDEYQYCALNNFQYNNSEACEACINVTGPKGSVLLRVVDRCPKCLSGDVDMHVRAFTEIADEIDGRVPISWQYVECPLQNNIEIIFKEGSSMFHTEIQIRNLKHAIETLEYLNDDGIWIKPERKLYNFFVEDNGISSPMTLRTTSVLGEELVFENISFGNNTPLPNNLVVSTNQQFSTPANCSTLSVTDNTIENLKLSYYPNPVKNELFIESNSDSFWNNKSIEVVSLNGVLVKEQKETVSTQTQVVKLNNISKGMYIVNIIENEKTHSSYKIIIN